MACNVCTMCSCAFDTPYGRCPACLRAAYGIPCPAGCERLKPVERSTETPVEEQD